MIRRIRYFFFYCFCFRLFLRYSVVKVLVSLLTSDRYPGVSSNTSVTLQPTYSFRQKGPAHRRAPLRRAISSHSNFLAAFVLLRQYLFLYYFTQLRSSVEMAGFEPATFALQRRCSPAELHPQVFRLVGLTGFEPVTPALSAQCSNQLSYKPDLSSA